jgi:hypothetical protein
MTRICYCQIAVKVATLLGLVQFSLAFAPLPPFATRYSTISRPTRLYQNFYDVWRSGAVADTMHLCEENVQECLDEFIQSDYGKQMFGCHDLAASIDITGELSFVDLTGPEVTLMLDGAFWHRRESVLGRAAVWLNARMPEITDVNVANLAELEDFEEIFDEDSGEQLYVDDKRAPDFNGDRGTMEYQGIDPDVSASQSSRHGMFSQRLSCPMTNASTLPTFFSFAGTRTLRSRRLWWSRGFHHSGMIRSCIGLEDPTFWFNDDRHTAF